MSYLNEYRSWLVTWMVWVKISFFVCLVNSYALICFLMRWLALSLTQYKSVFGETTPRCIATCYTLYQKAKFVVDTPTCLYLWHFSRQKLGVFIRLIQTYSWKSGVGPCRHFPLWHRCESREDIYMYLSIHTGICFDFRSNTKHTLNRTWMSGWDNNFQEVELPLEILTQYLLKMTVIPSCEL